MTTDAHAARRIRPAGPHGNSHEARLSAIARRATAQARGRMRTPSHPGSPAGAIERLSVAPVGLHETESMHNGSGPACHGLAHRGYSQTALRACDSCAVAAAGRAEPLSAPPALLFGLSTNLRNLCNLRIPNHGPSADSADCADAKRTSTAPRGGCGDPPRESVARSPRRPRLGTHAFATARKHGTRAGRPQALSWESRTRFSRTAAAAPESMASAARPMPSARSLATPAT